MTRFATALLTLALLMPAMPGTPASSRARAPRAAPLATARGVTPRAADQFALLRSLEGEWRAPTERGTMVDVFRPIAAGSAVLHEEWLDGKQLTATVFYLAGSELHADHFCDLKNQLLYVAAPAKEANVIEFRLREAQNLEAHPRHFHATSWWLRDASHLTQEWQVAENGKELRVVVLEFTRTTRS